MGVSFNHRHRKCLTPDYYRERPPNQGQVVRKVELWHRFRGKGMFCCPPHGSAWKRGYTLQRSLHRYFLVKINEISHVS